MHYPIVRIAHRGASVDYPENTLLAFRRALEQGVDMLELDVQLTRDGELVVIHDATLERTTNGAGFVSDHPCSAIRRLDAGRGERIPTLAEVINLVRSTSVGLCVEVKVDGKSEVESLAVTDAVIKALEKADFLGRTILTSFLPAALLRAKVLQPRVAIMLDPSPQDGTLTLRQICEQTLAAGANCISYDHRFVTQAVADEARLAGLSLWPWGPGDFEDICHVLQLGVPGVMTNRPDELNRALNNLSLNPGLHSISSRKYGDCHGLRDRM